MKLKLKLNNRPTNFKFRQNSVGVLHHDPLGVCPAANSEDVCREGAGDDQGGELAAGECEEKAGETEDELDHDDSERGVRVLVEAAADLQEDAGTQSSRQTGPRTGLSTAHTSRDRTLSRLIY